MYTVLYIYIYIYSVYILCICVYIYIYREREIDTCRGPPPPRELVPKSTRRLGIRADGICGMRSQFP